jgi:hypothetical protein
MQSCDNWIGNSYVIGIWVLGIICYMCYVIKNSYLFKIMPYRSSRFEPQLIPFLYDCFSRKCLIVKL